MTEVFAGRYALVDPLGSGGMGTVWRAWDCRDNVYVAAKVLRQSDSAALLRFMREQAFRVNHPHVVAPKGWAGADERVLFTMDLVHGDSLARLIGDFGPLPQGWVTLLLDQLLAALEAVAAHGLVHRDVKPANLLLRPTGRQRPHLLLGDFGVAAKIGEPRLTESSTVLGTPGYSAPEAAAGVEPEPRQDLYSAGMVAQEMLLGTRPISSEGPADLPCDPALQDVIRRLVEPQPDDRFASATHARAALGQTGLVPAPDVVPDDAGLDIEVFDHCPELPPGYGPDGPTAAIAAVGADSPPARRQRLRSALASLRNWRRLGPAVAVLALAGVGIGTAVGGLPLPWSPQAVAGAGERSGETAPDGVRDGDTGASPGASSTSSPSQPFVTSPGPRPAPGPLPSDGVPLPLPTGGPHPGPEPKTGPTSAPPPVPVPTQEPTKAPGRSSLSTRGPQDLLARSRDGGLHLLRNSGGVLGDPEFVSKAYANYPTLRRGDVDGDGYDDLLAIDGNGAVFAARNNRAGSFAGTRALGISGYTWTGAADVNHDGYDDIVGTRFGDLFVHTNTRNGRFGKARALDDHGYKYEWIGVADLNGDGFDDLAGYKNAEMNAFINDGAGDFSSWKRLAHRGFNYPMLTTADINGDGADDVLGKTALGEVRVFFSDTRGDLLSRQQLDARNYSNFAQLF